LTQTSGLVFLVGGVETGEESADADNELEGGVSLLAFDLQNRTGSVAVAQDTFKVKLNSGATHYQFVSTAPRHFVLNVFNADGTTFQTITGFKQIDNPEQSWFTRFGMPVMLVGSMLLSRWMRPTPPTGAAPAANAPAAAAAGGESKKSK
jgi:hypothetical protein